MTDVPTWKVTCLDGGNEKWTKEVQLSEQDMRTLLQMLLCRKLSRHEIIGAMAGNLGHLLEVRSEGGNMHTAASTLLHYTARKVRP